MWKTRILHKLIIILVSKHLLKMKNQHPLISLYFLLFLVTISCNEKSNTVHNEKVEDNLHETARERINNSNESGVNNGEPINEVPIEILNNNPYDFNGQCCVFSIHLANKQTRGFKPSKVLYTSLEDTEVLWNDPDNWSTEMISNNKFYWIPKKGFPKGSFIDNDFSIAFETTNRLNFKIEYLDKNDNVLVAYIFNIPCNIKFDEKKDWKSYRKVKNSTIPHGGEAIAVPEDADCDYDGDYNHKTARCDLETNIQCASGNQYQVNIIPPTESYDTYNVIVSIGGNTQTPFVNVMPSIVGSPGELIEIEFIGYIEEDNTPKVTVKCYAEFTLPNTFPLINVQNEFANPLCSNSKDISISNPSYYSQIDWSCSSCASFNYNSGNFNHEFAPGNHTINVEVTDIYGCVHSTSVNVNIPVNCEPDFEVLKVKFCECNPGTNKTDVVVTFRNNSSGGVCPHNYSWQFGDGLTVVSTNNEIITTHTYSNVSCSGGNYEMKLTMNDANECNEIKTKSIKLTPCAYDFNFFPCDDGTVFLVPTNSAVGTWDLADGSRSWSEPSTYINIFDNSPYEGKIRACFPTTGQRKVQFTGHDPITHCECTVTKVIEADREDCCQENGKNKFSKKFSEDGNDYKIKVKLKTRVFPLYWRVKAKTKLKKKRKLFGSENLFYWKGTKADEIRTTIGGQVREKDPITNGDCPCEIPRTISEDSGLLSNSKKAKCEKPIGHEYRTKEGEIHSEHSIKVGTYEFDTLIYTGFDKDCENC